MIQKPQVDVFDFDNSAEKRMVLERVRKLKGLHEVSIKPRRFVRSLSQNRFYWAAVVGSFADWLSEEWGEEVKAEQAHDLLKRQFLPVRELVDAKTGEVYEIPATTTNLDTEQFSAYVERCIKWLGESWGIEVLTLEDYQEEPKRTLKQDLGESIIMARNAKRKTA